MATGKNAKNKDPIESYGEWSVMGDGTLVGSLPNPISQKMEMVEFYPDRLNQPDLILNLHAGDNINWNHFMPAYILACQTAKVKNVNVQMDFE